MKPVLILHCSQKSDSPRQLDWCLENFRQHHPEMPGVLISDGLQYWHATAAKRFGLRHVCGEYWKHVRFGGLWLQRMLENGRRLAAEAGCDTLWKIDPDTWIRRPFASAPPDADYFGHLHNPQIPHIQGGCAFLKVTAAERMLAALGDPVRFADFSAWLPAELPEEVRRWVVRTGWLSSDFVTLRLMHELHLTLADWPEIHSVCNLTALPSDLSPFAVVHPHKLPSTCL